MAAQHFPNDFELSLIDIGAAGGIHPRWGDLSNPQTSVLMFEPEAKAFEEMDGVQTGRIKILPIALSDVSTNRTLHIARKGMCSSLHERNFDFVNRFPEKERFEIIGEEEMPTEPLDENVAKQDFGPIDFIKIDVEGHENSVIASGKNTLSQAIGIEAEMLFAPLFIGGATFCDQHKSYTEMGYELYDLQRYYWKREIGKNMPSTGQIIYCNGLYLKSPENIIKDEFTDARRVRAALRVYASFGLFDLVKELLVLARSNDLISKEDADLVGTCLAGVRYSQNQEDHMGFVHRLLQKVAKILDALSRKIEPTWEERSWSHSDSDLG